MKSSKPQKGKRKKTTSKQAAIAKNVKVKMGRTKNTATKKGAVPKPAQKKSPKKIQPKATGTKKTPSPKKPAQKQPPKKVQPKSTVTKKTPISQSPKKIQGTSNKIVKVTATKKSAPKKPVQKQPPKKVQPKSASTKKMPTPKSPKKTQDTGNKNVKPPAAKTGASPTPKSAKQKSPITTKHADINTKKPPTTPSKQQSKPQSIAAKKTKTAAGKNKGTATKQSRSPKPKSIDQDQPKVVLTTAKGHKKRPVTTPKLRPPKRSTAKKSPMTGAAKTKGAFRAQIVQNENQTQIQDISPFLRTAVAKEKEVRQFLKQNPDVDIKTFAFHKSKLSELNWRGFKQKELFPVLLVYQRVVRLCSDIQIATMLIRAGLDSAHTITKLPQSKFIRDYEHTLQLVPDALKRIYSRARSVTRSVQHLRLKLKDQASKSYQALAVKNVPFLKNKNGEFDKEAATGTLKQVLACLSAPEKVGVPSYQDLFDDVASYTCDDDMSVYGPGAYFVDLMNLVQEYITSQNPGAKALQTRRPDMWTLPITEENTNSEIPYLQLVNEILEQPGISYFVNDEKTLSAAVKSPIAGITIWITGTINLTNTLEIGKSLTIISQEGTEPAIITGFGFMIYPPDGEVNITGITFKNCKSYNGGAVSYLYMSSGTVNNCIFSQNQGDIGGAFFSNGNATVTIQNSLFFENKCNTLGGAIYSTSVNPMIIKNCTFVNNSATATPEKNGSDIYLNFIRDTQGPIIIEKCIFWNNVAIRGPWKIYSTSISQNVTISNCDLRGGQETTKNIKTVKDNINKDPGYDADYISQQYPGLGYTPQTDTSIYTATLLNQIYPFNMPFNLSLSKVHLYLEALGTSLFSIKNTYQTSGANAALTLDQALSLLKISPQEYTFWSTPVSDAMVLEEYYGIGQNGFLDFDLNGSVNGPYTFRTSDFRRWTDLSQDDLIQLINQDLSPAEILEGDVATKFFINDNETSPLRLNDQYRDPAQNDETVEVLENVTLDRFDRLNRFIRLTQKIGWSFTEVDTALQSFASNSDPVIDDQALVNLAQLQQLKSNSNTAVDSLTALWAGLKYTGLGSNTDAPKDLYDQIYNPQSLISAGQEVWPPDISLTLTIDPQSAQSSSTLTRLQACLQLNQDDVVAIGTLMLPASSNSITLDLDGGLLWFYRYQLLSQLTNLSVSDLIQFLDMIGLAYARSFTTQTANSIIQKATLIQQSGLSISDWQIMLSSSPPLPFNDLDLMDACQSLVVDFNAKIKNFLVQPTSFVSDKIDADTSQLIFDTLQFPDSGNYIDDNGYILPSYLKGATDYTGEIHHVPYDFATIQDAIDAAKDNELVLVDVKPDGAPYAGEGNVNLNFYKKKITLKSVRGPEATIIDLENKPSSFGVEFNHNEGFSSVLDGFTFKNGGKPKNTEKWTRDCVIFCQDSSPTLRNCIFTQNHLTYSSIILLHGSAIKIINCIFYDNDLNSKGSEERAVALHIADYEKKNTKNPKQTKTIKSAPRIRYCLFYNNVNQRKVGTGAIYSVSEGNTNMHNSIIWANQQAATYADVAQKTDNLGTYGKIYIGQSLVSSTVKLKSIAQFGKSKDKNNIQSDPLFIDPASGNFSLRDTSPCWKTGQIIGPISTWILDPFYEGQKQACVNSLAQFFAADADQVASVISYFYRIPQKDTSSPYSTFVDILPEFSTVDPLSEKEKTTAKTLSVKKKSLIGLRSIYEYLVGVKNLSLSTKMAFNILFHPERYGIQDLSELTFDNIEILLKLQQWMSDQSITDTDVMLYLASAAAATSNLGSTAANSANASNLSDLCGWNENHINALIKAYGYDISSLPGVLLVSDCMEMADKLSLDPDLLIAITGLTDVTSDIANSLFDNIVSLQQTSDIQAVSNQVLNLKRGALVPYSIWKLNSDTYPINNERDLYKYLLIDVQMGEDMTTSRIVQATQSLQLYVHRCLMGLEPEVTTVTLSEEYWSWMKNYRVWEANRKVFLYPENYLDPSLRQDKTPLFQDLEDKILQAEITTANVTQYYNEYLDQFIELSGLKIAGACFYPPESIRNFFKFKTAVECTPFDPNQIMDLIQTNQQTIEVWLSLRAFPFINEKFTIVATKNYMSGKGWSLQQYYDANKKINVEFSIFIDDKKQTCKVEDISQYANRMVWVHLAGTYDGSTAQLWVNGESINSVTSPGTINYDNSGILMGDHYPYYWHIAEVRLWNKALLGEILENLYQPIDRTNSSFTDLIGYWRFQGADTIQDSAHHFMDALLNNTTQQIGFLTYPIMPDSGMSLMDTYYIAGHTQPPSNTYYYCQYTITHTYTPKDDDSWQDTVGNESWTPWQKIDLPINATYVSPIFIFQKLFLFWVELQPSKSASSISNGNSESAKDTNIATIKYAYENLNQGWSAPQNLTNPINLPQGIDTEDLAWQRVMVLPFVAPTDKILVLYGINESDPENINVYSSFVMARGAVINANLIVNEIDNLFVMQKIWGKTNQNEDGTSIFTTFIASAKTNNLLVANDFANVNIGTPGEKTYFGDVPPNSNLLPVTNQLGSYILETPNDSFLLLPQYSGGPPETVETSIANQSVPSSLDFSGGSLSVQKIDFVIDFFQIRKLCFACWIKPNSMGTGTVFQIGGRKLTNDSLTTVLSVYFTGASDTLSINIDIDGISQTAVIGTGEYITDDWNYLYINITNYTYVASYVWVQCFLNSDVQIPTFETTWNIRKITALTAGMYYSNSNQSLKTYQGSISQFKVWSDNCLYLYRDRFETDVEANLYLYWPMTEGDGNVVYDRSGNGRDGTVAGTYNTVTGKFTNPSINWQPNLMYPIQQQTIKLTPSSSQTTIPSSFRTKRLTSSAGQILSEKLFAGGIDALLTIASQQTQEFLFESMAPADSSVIISPTDNNQISFDPSNAYASYFWEIFFHIPYLLAHKLNQNKNYQDAQTWFQYIFHPTAAINDITAKVWRFLPLREAPTYLIDDLDLSNSPAVLSVYENDPFDPYAIANLRVPTTYQKALVMATIDNYLDWGDSLFAQDTRESINEATMYYVLAYDLLGEKPLLKPYQRPAPETYDNILSTGSYGKDGIPDFLILLETLTGPKSGGTDPLPSDSVTSYYFCLPENDFFVSYWDTVQDRLYKIRYSMTLLGVTRSLALFSPELDPRQIIQALASGGSLNSIFNDLLTDVPPYRFPYILEKAKGMIQTVMQLGSSLLSVLEKKDAEELSLLRSQHEVALLQMMETVKTQQIEEAVAAQQTLQLSQQNTQHRLDHYNDLIEDGLLTSEDKGLKLMETAFGLQTASSAIKAASIIAYGLPNVFGLANGGMQFGQAVDQGSQILDLASSILGQRSSVLATMSQFERRSQDWQLQAAMAGYDVAQIEQQIQAAQIRVAVVEQELAIHQKNWQHAQSIETYLTNKFTDAELYNWMVTQLSGLYFQSYQLAYKYAKIAEKAYQFEKARSQTFITYGYWNSLKKGLLSGETLMLDVQRMEQSYLQTDVRRLEIEKTISLLQINPYELYELKTKGSCTFDLSEILYDYDYPGHYCRQIKALSLSIPAVVGPYQQIHATLTQKNNKVILQPNLQATLFLLDPANNSPVGDPTIMREDWNPRQGIALSKGINDAGLFELNFRDERYLPFEGTGAVSSWQLDLPIAANRFDLSTITDVILTVQYTALSDGALAAQLTADDSPLSSYQGSRFFNMAQDSNNWQSFIADTTGKSPLDFSLALNQFPANLSSVDITLDKDESNLEMYLVLKENGNFPDGSVKLKLKFHGDKACHFTFNSKKLHGKSMFFGTSSDTIKIQPEDLISCSITIVPTSSSLDSGNKTPVMLDPGNLSNIGLIIKYDGDLDWGS